MNEAGALLRALMHRVSALTSLFPLLLVVPSLLTLRCHLYHKIWEDGHKLEIVPDICSSNSYCVYATYSDPDPVKKNGFSMGCDRVDCEQSEDEAQAELWRIRPGTGELKCRRHRDYGNRGEVCCCKTDMCNDTRALMKPPFILLLFAIIIFVW